MYGNSRFSLSPLPLNTTVDTEAVFSCQHTTANSIGWTVNGVKDNVQATMYNGISYLTIPTSPRYDEAVIQCIAYFAESSIQESDTAVLMIQGTTYYY